MPDSISSYRPPATTFLAKDPLLQPLTVKGLTLKNRVMSTAHAPGYTKDGLPGERYQLYHEEKAKGGLALTMFGGNSMVSKDAPSGHLDLSDDRCIAPLAAFAMRIHRHQCALMCQISHLGRRARANTGHWLPLVAPSPIREPLHRGFVKEIELGDIRRIVADFAEASERCREAGLDGIELLATSHLIGQFLSPAVNCRTDAYGGSPERRARFAIEVLEAVRARAGGMIVSLRLSGDELLEGGLNAAECIEIAQRFARSGLVDVLNVLGGNAFSEPGMARNMPGLDMPTAPYLHLAAAIRAETGLPVFHASRITDLDTARHAIAEGLIDMVAMTRAHMADPHIVSKLLRGEVDRIRPCVGARHCLESSVYGGGAACIHNPATGRERSIPQNIRKSDGAPQNIIIAGGGPAGMEAARTAALRGHRVRLFEAAQELGGQVLTAAKIPGSAEMREIVGWLGREIAHAGVEVHTGCFIEASTITSLAPDIVVDATGGMPGSGTVEDPENLAISSWDVLNGIRKVRGRVLVFDDHGGHQGLGCALAISAQPDTELTIVTPERSLGVEMGAINRPRYLEALYRRKVTMRVDTQLVRLGRRDNLIKALLRNSYTGEIEAATFDGVIIESGTEPNTLLYDTLALDAANLGEIDLDSWANGERQPLPEQGFALWRIGDAVAHRGIHAAILDARRLCQNL